MSPQLFFFSLRKFLSFSYERGRVTVKIMLSSPLGGVDGAAVKLHDLFGDSETQACAAAGTSRGVQSVELLKIRASFSGGIASP